MRWPLITILLTAACSQEANHLGSPFLWPMTGASTVIGNAAYEKRRGEVELIVKSNYEEIKTDIRAGGGPVLTKSMDAAGIAERDRPARIIQLQSDMGLYQTTPGALVTALMVYGG
ncbi:hypothetical protein BC777_0617 [Yoonia maricola]|uniref:Uncharacterized protein n=1 Tax=Yoonia maricola TaxID=420999 RepID=A0A2M8WLH3_9RHOB|nr:hypothetical protein [Yoonia maricola]PJI91777.1 hypothetical protein BC777_0617 [Yoonia maricola]